MAIALTIFTTQVVVLLPNLDTAKLPSASQQACIYAALEEYSRDRPDMEIDDVTGDGGRFYDIATVMTAWSEGFSRVQSVEYPAATIADDEEPQYLDPEDWRDDYWAADKRYLYLPNHAPAATETMRVTYMVPYAFSGTPSATTVPAQDFYAICNLAAALCCEALAAGYSPSSEASTLNADSVQHRSRAQEYAARAKEFRAFYELHLGLGKEQEPKAAGAFVDWDTTPGWPAGRQYVFHGNR